MSASIARWLMAAICALGFCAALAPAAQAEVRTLKLHNLHTKEKAEIIFKRNGRYDQAGLKKLNVFLRDWRRNEPTKMDPRLLDLVWEAHRASGSRDYIHVVSAYRSPATNSMLRGRSSGVAKKSQHMLGKAMDFYIPGVPLKKLRDIGLKMQGGGVGYYPRSGSPFVHMDVGNVRHWPSISRKELAGIFPNGKTLHIPSDGKPLPGYEQAMAAYKSRNAAGAPAIALAGPTTSGGRSGKSGGLLATLFGGGADEEEDNNVTVAAAPTPKKATAPAQKPAARPQGNLPGITVLSPDQTNRAAIPQQVEEPQTPETIIAALPIRSIPLPGAAPRPKVDLGIAQPVTPDTVPFGVADTSPVQAAALVAEAENTPFAQADVLAAIPVPSLRPQDAGVSDEAPQLLALAEVETALPSTRPNDVAANDEVNDEVRALLEKAANDEDTVVAAIPTLRPAFDETENISTAAVKTTGKSARPTADAARPEPKAVLVAAEPKLARWALNSGDYVVRASQETTAPRYAYNLVRTAPTQVYTTGFRAGNEMDKAHQFTGAAVNFISVARFSDPG
ncbi:DUF882 domain-containing protein [Aquamicrobium segne]|uniref:Murein endopeptidase K n=1 Tax=Aquamicrobium segne TaxID=469547 RepID=A0ABW0GXG3_9HYPH